MANVTISAIPPAQVTVADIYAEVRAMRDDVARALTRIEVADARHTLIIRQVDDHEARLRVIALEVPAKLTERLTVLERWQWRASAVVATVGVITGLISGSLGYLIGHVK